ncbi:hypothetical protein ANN_06249 [Periplaneta americana]|uniref:MADF domain-containing protein n=1 Tax=Periplaneta americana TaxID=6978 RepID=A0ABQ8TEV4_PERAM|nr:hypothetical protein ANN_06249 [Periplaneta americana]
MKVDNAGEMSPGSSTESYPAFAHIDLRENPGKNLNQQEDRDITYALFCSVLCIMEQVLFDEILILSVEENPQVYDKRRASYKDEKMKANTWLSIAASLNTDRDNVGEMTGSDTECYPAFAHVGFRENPGRNLNQGSTATYRPVTKSTYYSVKRFIKSTCLDFNKQNLITQSQGKKWNSLHHNPQLIPDLPRKSSVAAFRLAIGHDCLAKNLHRIGIYQSPNCPLCNSNQEMDSEHLKICASVDGHDNIFEKYWSARASAEDHCLKGSPEGVTRWTSMYDESTYAERSTTYFQQDNAIDHTAKASITELHRAFADANRMCEESSEIKHIKIQINEHFCSTKSKNVAVILKERIFGTYYTSDNSFTTTSGNDPTQPSCLQQLPSLVRRQQSEIGGDEGEIGDQVGEVEFDEREFKDYNGDEEGEVQED